MTDDAYGVLAALPPEYVDRLLALAREVAVPADSAVFEEDGPAERFWILRTGLVALDFQIPGYRSAVVETIGPGELLGWSWLFEPYRWHLGARTREAVTAYEFDAVVVRELVHADTSFGLALTTCVAATIGRRLRACRTRLIDMYEPRSLGPQPGGATT